MSTSVSPVAAGQRYVFISYASSDAELAHRALETLERAGIHCWIADRDIEVSTSYPAAITTAITGSAALLLLLTEAANSSPHVLREVELAFDNRHPILPVRIAHATPSSDLQYFLSTSQWLDAGTAFDDEDLKKIEPVLRELIEHGRITSVAIAGHRTPLVWLVLAVIAVLIIGIVTTIMWRSRQQPAAPPQQQSATSPPPTNTETNTPSVPTPAPSPSAPERPSPVPSTTSKAKEQVNPRDGQTYVWIAPGRFVMGCSDGDPNCEPDEKPTHAVEIARGFWLARTEVTDAAYRKATKAGVARGAATAPELPIVEVNWAEAKAYCGRVGGRLPTEAEWEYAARAGTKTRYYDNLNAIAWFAGNSEDHRHPVGTKEPNAFGLYDMLGNVSEWVLDRYYNAYDDTSDPAHPDQPLAGNASGVARGGSWVSEANGVRVSRRLEMLPDAEEPHIGFRCAADRLQ